MDNSDDGCLLLCSELVFPSLKENKKIMDYCDLINANAKTFYTFTLPCSVVIVIVLAVVGFALFRSSQIRTETGAGTSVEEARHDIELEGTHTLNGTPSQDRLFTVQAVVSEFYRESEENRSTRSGNVEDDMVIEDIELDNMETSSLDVNVSISAMVHENSQEIELNLKKHSMIDNPQNSNQCLPGLVLMQTLNKYLALISLLILGSQIPWNLTNLYGFITNSGCENPTFRVMTEVSCYGLFCLNIFLPILVKIKLDRLSE